MALTLTDLSDLTKAEVDQAQSLVIQLLKDYSSDIDTKRGSIGDIVIYLSGLLHASERDLIDRVRRSSSLVEIAADSELADTDIVDAALSNYLVTRRDGTKAAGRVRVVRSVDGDLAIPAGTTLTGGGVSFTTTDDYRILSSGSTATSDTDVVQRLLGNGSYAAAIPVEASSEGSDGNLPRNTAFEFDDLENAGVLSVTSIVDFTGGTSEETNADLLARAQEGIAVKTAFTKPGVLALFRQLASMADIVDVSLVGYGDVEQKRYHSILPVAFGGRVDIWVRNGGGASSTTVTKTAVLNSKTASGGLWQVNFEYDEIPGFYDVTSIVPSGTNGSGFSLDSDTRSYDVSEAAVTPDIESATEAAYSRWQTAAINFIDTDYDVTDLVVGQATRDYDLTVRHIDGIDEAQDLLDDQETGTAGVDFLVRAAVPCFVELNFTIKKKTAEETPDTDQIKADLVGVINNLGFSSSIPGSTVLHTIHKHLIGTQTVVGLDMAGTIRRPDGVTVFIQSGESLDIPSDPDNLVSNKTTSFYIDEDSIGITVSSS